MSVKRHVYTVPSTAARKLVLEGLGFTAHSIYLSVESANLRISYDGSVPTPDDGHVLYDGQHFTLTKPSLIRNFQMIATTGTAKINVTFESG